MSDSVNSVNSVDSVKTGVLYTRIYFSRDVNTSAEGLVPWTCIGCLNHLCECAEGLGSAHGVVLIFV